VRFEDQLVEWRKRGSELELVVHARAIFVWFEPMVVPHPPEWAAEHFVAKHPRPLVAGDLHSEPASQSEMACFPRDRVSRAQHSRRGASDDTLTSLCRRGEMDSDTQRKVEAPLGRRRNRC